MSHHESTHQIEANSTDVFGFWIYILTDCVVFSCLFATYLVLNHPGAYGMSLKRFIELPYVLGETLFLLTSSFTLGLTMVALNHQKRQLVTIGLVMTFLLGAGFLWMELREFNHLLSMGYTPQSSGAASAFFVLVGTHGFHVLVGLIWILMMLLHLNAFKLCPAVKKRMTYLGLFWTFLDIIWIFIFTIVYLMGVIS